MKLTFFGGTKIVTGALYLFEFSNKKVLVDCGLIQGSRFLEEKNFEKWSFDPQEIDYIFITHSHLDHIGRLPKIVKDGFKGSIFSTPPTKDFAYWLLKDSAHILKKEAKSLHKRPLYQEEDIEKTMGLWEKIDYHEPFNIDGVEVEFFNAGHILGSAFISFKTEKGRLVFSGDLGNSPMPLLPPLEEIPSDTKWTLIESAYGDRLHEQLNKRKEILEDTIEEVALKKSTLMIPAFAMERTQEILYELNDLVENKKVPKIESFLDSTLALRLTEVYKRYENYLSFKAFSEVQAGDDLFNFPHLHFVHSHEESRAIKNIEPPKLIIAGSGMMHGGRIVYHLKDYLPDKKNVLLVVGYQAKGSLGRKLLEGAKKVRIYGQEVEVRAEIKEIHGYSAHADQSQLLNWLRPAKNSLEKVFVVQGEEGPANALATKIEDELAIEAKVPDLNYNFEI